jgi:DNA primase
MQMYKCFGCAASGDVFSFLEAYEGITFREALEDLAKKAGIELTKQAPTKAEIETKRLYEIMDLAKEYYSFILLEHPAGEEGRKYLQKRSVDIAYWKTYSLGWAPKSWRSLTDYLVKKKQYSPGEVERTGLLIKGRGSDYDRFRGRVMFPLTDFRGRVVGFSGRTLEEDAKEAKYINTPETDLYHKRELLFGITAAKPAIRKKDRVIVMEGEFDVISSFIAGVRNVVGIKGSALTEDQIKTLLRLTRNVTLCLDADKAGVEATKRGIEVADKLGVSVEVLSLSGGKDPDEIARSNKALWKEMVTKSISAYQFYIESAFKTFDNNTGEGKKKITEALVPMLAKIGNSVEQVFYLKEVAKRLGVGEEAVRTEMEKWARGKEIGQVKPERKEEAPTDRFGLLEKYVFGLLWQLSGDQLVEGWELIKGMTWQTPGFNRLQEVLETEIENTGKNTNLKDLAKKMPSEITALIGEAYMDEEVMKVDEAELVKNLSNAVGELKRLGVRQAIKTKSDEIGDLEKKEERSPEEEEKLSVLQSEVAKLMSKLN